MKVIETAAALTALMQSHPDLVLRDLLATRQSQLGIAIEESVRFLLVEPPDTIADVEAAIGFPLTMEGEPTWDVARLHCGRLVELVFVLSDDGPADVLLLPTHDGIDPNLIDLLQRQGALVTEPERHAAA